MDVLEKQVADLTRPRELCDVATSIDAVDLQVSGGQAAETPAGGAAGAPLFSSLVSPRVPEPLVLLVIVVGRARVRGRCNSAEQHCCIH